MKTIIVLIILAILCSGAEACDPIDNEHYMIVVLVWDNETGEPEAGVPVAFGETHTLYTESDGSVLYDTANINDLENNSVVIVSCKYGNKSVPILYRSGDVLNWGTTVTFNEPDESVVIAILAAMGLAATALGGGIYLLRRKTNIVHETNDDINEDIIMEENTEVWKLKKDFGVRALLATLSLTGYATVAGISVYRGDMNMIADVSQMFLPIVTSIIVFYFGGSMIRDGKK